MKSIDVDGVLLDFVGHLFAWHQQDIPSDLCWDHSTIGPLHANIENNDVFWRTLPVLNQFQTIYKYYKFDCYLTAIPLEIVPFRWENLMRRGFPQLPIFDCGHKVSDKLECALRIGVTHHIDDRPETVNEFNKNGIKALEYIPYYMTQETKTEYQFIDFKNVPKLFR